MTGNGSELGLDLPTLIIMGVLLVLALPGLGYFAWKTWETLQDKGLARTDTVVPIDLIPALFLVNMYLFFWGLNLLLVYAAKDLETPPATEISYGALLFQVILMVGILLVIWLFLWRRGISSREFFGIDSGKLGLAVSRTALYLAALFFPLALIGLGWNLLLTEFAGMELEPQEVVYMFLNSENVIDKVVITLFAVVFAPITEEVIFRGYIYQVLKRYITFVPALIVVSALFALIHFSVVAFVPLFVLALVLTLAYERTGTLITPILIHAVFNGTSVMIMWFTDPTQLPS